MSKKTVVLTEPVAHFIKLAILYQFESAAIIPDDDNINWEELYGFSQEELIRDLKALRVAIGGGKSIRERMLDGEFAEAKSISIVELKNLLIQNKE